MINRRDFLGVSSLAAVGAAAGCQPGPSQGEGSGPGEGGALPPSIAALTSRAHEAIPITVGERESRIEKARRLMAAKGMDALMLTGGTSLVYFTPLEK